MSQDTYIRLQLWRNIANYPIVRALNYDTRNEFLPSSEWLTALSPGRTQRGAPAPDPKDVTRNEHTLRIFSGRLHSVSFQATCTKNSGSQPVVLNRRSYKGASREKEIAGWKITRQVYFLSTQLVCQLHRLHFLQRVSSFTITSTAAHVLWKERTSFIEN